MHIVAVRLHRKQRTLVCLRIWGPQAYGAVEDHDKGAQRASDAADSPSDQEHQLQRGSHDVPRHVAAIVVRFRRLRRRRDVPQEAAVERDQSALELVVDDREELEGEDVDHHLLHPPVLEDDEQVGQEDEGVVHQPRHDQVCERARGCTREGAVRLRAETRQHSGLP